MALECLSSVSDEEHDEERYQPLETLRTLIKFNLHTQAVLYDDLDGTGRRP